MSRTQAVSAVKKNNTTVKISQYLRPKIYTWTKQEEDNYFILFHFTLYYFILFYFIYSLTIKLKGYQILMCGIIHLVIATRDMFNLSLFFALPTSSSTCQYELTQKSYAFTSVARMTLVQPF